MSVDFDSPWEFKNISVSFSLLFKPTVKILFFYLIQTNILNYLKILTDRVGGEFALKELLEFVCSVKCHFSL